MIIDTYSILALSGTFKGLKKSVPLSKFPNLPKEVKMTHLSRVFWQISIQLASRRIRVINKDTEVFGNIFDDIFIETKQQVKPK